MDSAHPKNTNNLLNLTEAAKKLGVSPEMLLNLNEYNILKPVLTLSGEIGYTSEQIENFQRIRELSPNKVSEAHVHTQEDEQDTNPQVQQVVLPEINASIKTTIHEETRSAPTARLSKRSITKHFSLPYFLTLSASSFLVFLMLFSAVFHIQNGENEAENSVTSKKASLITAQPSQPPKTLHEQAKNEGLGAEKVSALADNSTLGQQDSAKAAADSASGESPLPKHINSPANSNALDEFASKGSCPGCVEKEDTTESVFDNDGNIRGQEEQDDLLAVGGLKVPEVDENTPGSQSSTSPALLITIAIAGFFGVLFILKNQLAGSFASSSPVLENHLSLTTPVTTNKILEVSQKTDGSIMLHFEGREYKVSKPELDSESDQFISRLMELTAGDAKEIEYDTLTDEQIHFNAPLSKLVTRLGFVGIKRDLFFPRTSKTKVLFRKYVTEDDLLAMNLPQEQIGTHL